MVTGNGLVLLRGALQGVASKRLLFIHGFLGSSADWQSVVPYLPPSWEVYAINLPGHGRTASPIPDSFSGFTDYIHRQLQRLPNDGVPLVLLGYSLGARLLMHYATRPYEKVVQIQALVLEGGNFGLQQLSEIESRRKSDSDWVERFTQQNLRQVLELWYQQGVFASLNQRHKEQLVAERIQNDGKALAQVMSATSLARQAYLLPALKRSPQTMYYLVGELDAKFLQLYRVSKITFEVVSGAGHNAHKEQPQKYAQKLTQLLSFSETESL
ncbi:2-succinyl-6-hydroxy-2,4-cyclohexadiene-1-carboxylate synthase [Vibrio rarus]|uniref:2-succinyl-6-hydroxy-2, 4-cyclohexadiene-1-carboxylate synthase n=1 Tax=Vibrio rarus TaxID=413403 RepID=UPI0021C48F7F|nr:2-succinyl-6-hydroxy-2,4-cyclohexadiene-1-carboxylate synthase [Vibrio rarus]